MHAALLVGLVLALLTACGGGGGGGGGGDDLVTVPLPPGSGITVQRVVFLPPFDGASAPTWGRILIDPAVVAEVTGRTGGVLNIADAEHWFAVNVPVPPPEEPPLAVYFDVGGPPVPDIPGFGDPALYCIWSDRSIEDMRPQIAAWPSYEYTFGRSDWNARGLGQDDDGEGVYLPGLPPNATALDQVQHPGSETWARYQAVVNVECAVNQCFPMAIANGLQYLEGEGVLTVPHTHALGLKGDSTLVGQLDTDSDRPVTTRLVGEGVWFPPMLEGKFQYLDDNQLGTFLDHRHQGRGYGDAGQGEALPAGNFTRHSITSTDDGAAITWDWIVARMNDDCALEAVYTFEKVGGGLGAHAVRITGVGVFEGRAWVRYSHDAMQSDDAQGREDVLVWWGDLDNDGLWNFGGAQNELRFVLAECP